MIHCVGQQLVCHVWQTGSQVPITSEALSVLQGLSEWTSAGDLRDRIAPGADESSAKELLHALHSLGLVEPESGLADDPGWVQWSPEATFFHFATKNSRFFEDLAQHDRDLAAKATENPPPAPTKRIEGRRQRLAAEDISTDLQSSLSRRRTWRRYSTQPLPSAALGALLSWTFKVQARGRVPGQGDVVVKTSPSGGARHPIEAYVLVWNVDGVEPGAYHYDCATDELVDLNRPVSADEIPALLAHQTFFAGASVAVILCPVFARTMWRYGQSRAYRTILIEAGHLAQTFCLVATSLGLAPFTTMAFSESALESLLGLDGIRECPIYVAGVGMPDPDAGANPGRWRAE